MQSFIHLASQFMESHIETLIAMTLDPFSWRNKSLHSFQPLLNVYELQKCLSKDTEEEITIIYLSRLRLCSGF